MLELRNDEIKQVVRENYSKVAKSDSAGCGSGCGCSSEDYSSAESVSMKLGYSENDVKSVPEGANMGLGCGNPQAIASLKPGETVLDLGSGGGFDCFLASRAVGDDGKVIGVDMTPDMISKARKNLEKTGATNIEFRLGEIEHLPVADNSVDVIISNCVINLSPQKDQVYREAFRVLKPGGRLAISDVVATADLPEQVKKDLKLYTGCVAGAESINSQETMLKESGFDNIKFTPKDSSKELIKEWAPGRELEDFVTSAAIEAVKPLVN